MLKKVFLFTFTEVTLLAGELTHLDIDDVFL